MTSDGCLVADGRHPQPGRATWANTLTTFFKRKEEMCILDTQAGDQPLRQRHCLESEHACRHQRHQPGHGYETATRHSMLQVAQENTRKKVDLGTGEGSTA